MEVTILHSRSGKTLGPSLSLSQGATVGDLKKLYYKQNPKYYPDRQSYRADQKGKSLKDEEPLANFQTGKNVELFFKDLGPQVGWTTVFLTEYAGPLVIYLLFYSRPALIYGKDADVPRACVVNVAAACWSFHYAKRLLETVFVHRFSHATMPIANIFKNSTYYWGFAALVAYFVNHPMYTTPSFGDFQIYAGLGTFMLGELGNFSAHILFKNLRPAGSKVRKIPFPDSNPLNMMFNFVSCPNYTYEVIAWIGFTIMTQCLPAGLFTLCGFYQMTVWAMGKHKNYKKEFSNYPRGRKSIVPFLI